jgi:citrate synthase
VRPSARYIGPGPRTPDQVEGFETITVKSIGQTAPA